MSPSMSPDAIRAAFSAAMSAMYRDEVPAYGTLMALVADVNEATLASQPKLRASLEATETLDRVSEERHGAIRLGTEAELAMMRRVFAVMGMFPVGYYDLSEAGVPVHSTAFRPVSEAALKLNPFRVFTSLLRLDLIADVELRATAEITLARRQIFSDVAVALVDKAERDGGLSHEDAALFVTEVLDTFRWHSEARVDQPLYTRLHDAHRLIADVVSFKGPHINHLTPRTLDIDAVQVQMPLRGIVPKAVVEGPPSRACPILLRQTSFKAVEERVSFPDENGNLETGSHTARFGEIEQRGIALTPKGRALYDRLLNQARATVRPAPDGSNADAYRDALARSFAAFPDDWNAMRKAGLGYFLYTVDQAIAGARGSDIEALIAVGAVRVDPIVYEDFLPVSAAGIFQSNLGDDAVQDFTASPNQRLFEKALGAAVLNEFEHYAGIERASIERCQATLKAFSDAA
ncbi:2-oxoadipate dioxygenase/decarboxylase HglS [Aminobacter carboxidus]|uniref:2-oxoadipate dioxygenase/decarboxylase n=1 Tax=Aminobacter carboxidus TaxID=376165 RepID=A0ABR9GVK0_9HYPH|nr:VOC family protein [Aminobacter carboxidus]MBE1207645.1 VOC family protein [Aminobacter carboxidus]